MKVTKLLLFTFVLFFISTKSVFAHVLQTDGSIGAVMHMTPADDPIAGENTTLFFDFKDTSGKFNPQNCTCVISILENNNQMSSETLFKNSNDSKTSVNFTFPEKGIYTIQITGTPKQSGSFEPFNLQYTVRVERETSNTQLNSLTTLIIKNLFMLFIGGVLLIGVIFYIAKRVLK